MSKEVTQAKVRLVCYWVMVAGDRTHPYRLPTVTKCRVIRQTPNTIRLQRPDGSEFSQPLYNAYCLPTRHSWDGFKAIYAGYQIAFDRLAEGLRQLGRYDQILRESSESANPLTPTVIEAYCPDRDWQWSATGNQQWSSPQVERLEAERHTEKMIHTARNGRRWGTQRQEGYFVCPDDEAWSVIAALDYSCQSLNKQLTVYLNELGTYGKNRGVAIGAEDWSDEPVIAAVQPVELESFEVADPCSFSVGDRVTPRDSPGSRYGLIEGFRRGRRSGSDRIMVRWLDGSEVDLCTPDSLLLDDGATSQRGVTVKPLQIDGGFKVGDRVTPKHRPGSRHGVIEGFRKHSKTPVIVRWMDSDKTTGFWGVDALLLDDEGITAEDTITTASGEATVTATDGEIVFANYGGNGTDQPHTVDGIVTVESDPLEGVANALAEIVGESHISADPELDWLASRINLKHTECESAIAQSIYAARDAGRLLIEARSKVKQRRSRNWLKWLDENFEGSQRTAYNYIAIAENWEEKIQPELGPNTQMGIRHAVRLLSSPESDPIEDEQVEAEDPNVQAAVERDEALTVTLEPGDYVQVVADDDQFGRVAIVNRILPSFEIAVDFDDGLTLSYPRHLLRLHARQAQLPLSSIALEEARTAVLEPGDYVRVLLRPGSMLPGIGIVIQLFESTVELDYREIRGVYERDLVLLHQRADEESRAYLQQHPPIDKEGRYTPLPIFQDEALTTDLEPGDYVQIIADDDLYQEIAVVTRTLRSAENGAEYIELAYQGIRFAYERDQLLLYQRADEESRAYLQEHVPPLEDEEEEPPADSSIDAENFDNGIRDPEILEVTVDADTQAVIEQMCQQSGVLSVIAIALNCCGEKEIVKAYDFASRRRYGMTFGVQDGTTTRF